MPAIKRLPPTECLCYTLPHMYSRFFSFKGLPFINLILLYFNIFKSFKYEEKINCSHYFNRAMKNYSKKKQVSWEYSLYTAITA